MPAGDTHAYRAQGFNRFLVLDVDIDFAKRTGIETVWRRNASASPYLQIERGQQAILSNLLRTLSASRRSDDLTGEDGIVCGSLMRVLSGTFAASSRLAAPANDYDGLVPLPARLQRVLDWAELRLADPISVTDMAAVAVQSESSFFDGFHRHIGTTPMRWLTEQRLLAARYVLLTSGGTIAIGELASQVGFTDQSAFSRAFSRRFGCSPVKMRLQSPIDLSILH